MYALTAFTVIMMTGATMGATVGSMISSSGVASIQPMYAGIVSIDSASATVRW
jgi:hypothetical protein